MKEHCVRCGKDTEYDVNTPIEMRLYFIEGSGQLCPTCYQHLYCPTSQPQMYEISDKRIDKEDETV